MTEAASFPPLHGYVPREFIASGGQSSIYRALHSDRQSFAALKVVPFPLHHQAELEAKAKQLVREMRIHETLKHKNILQLFGGETRQAIKVKHVEWPMGLYMILDLADGGDLFDKITPDVGLEEEIAHFYFRQLVSGLKYLGKQGICHRDIKPENCLLDGNGNLKVSDFGLATVYKYKGQERLLKDRCGSPPYAAPELAYPAPYAAEPVDVWSAGVLLFALLVGNTPWDEPTQNSAEFCAFMDGSLLEMDPWSRIQGGALDTLLRMLTLDAKDRIRIKDLEKLDWVSQPNPLLDSTTGLCKNGAEVFRRMAAKLRASGFVGTPGEEYEEMMQASQHEQEREAGGGLTATQQLLSQRGLDPNASFRGSMQLYSKLSMAPTQASNPNFSRFFSTTALDLLLSALQSSLDSLSLPNELVRTTSGTPSERLGTLYARLRVKTKDRRGMKMEFAIHVSKGFLPSEPTGYNRGAGANGRRSGLTQGMHSMQMDTDDEELDGGHSESRRAQEEAEGQDGLDVTLWKKVAEPIELKKVWKAVMSRLPSGMVSAT